MDYTLRLGLFLLLSASPAIAHVAHCERPAKPAFPDPKTIDPAVAEKLDQAMQKYSTGMNAYVACLTQEAQTANAEGTNTINFYNQKFLPEYNKRAVSQ